MRYSFLCTSWHLEIWKSLSLSLSPLLIHHIVPSTLRHAPNTPPTHQQGPVGKIVGDQYTGIGVHLDLLNHHKVTSLWMETVNNNQVYINSRKSVL